MEFTSILIGAVLGATLVALARRRARGARRLYAVALVVAALVYVAFAVTGGASVRWIVLEGVGVLLYGSVALIGMRRWRAALGIGWAAHVAWDLLLHLQGTPAHYTPTWYPWVCVGFDFVVAAAAVAPGVRRIAAHRAPSEPAVQRTQAGA